MTVSTTTTAIDSQPVFEYEGVVTGEAVLQHLALILIRLADSGSPLTRDRRC
jgi:uncharacterized protein YbjQ (UPF0145 family)